MAKDPLRTKLCDLLGIEYPIVAFTHCKDVALSATLCTGTGAAPPGSWCEEKLEKDATPARPGFDPAFAGKRAECDGGGPIAGTQFAGRQEFTGTLTGEYVDHGDPPWRWYLLADLTRKPEGYPEHAVWCESGSLFLLDDEPTHAGEAGKNVRESR